jgi:5-methylcytosine-specific restriction protein A
LSSLAVHAPIISDDCTAPAKIVFLVFLSRSYWLLPPFGSGSFSGVQKVRADSSQGGEHMARAGSRQASFYASQTWRKTRNAYLKSVGGLCERCLEHGIIRPARYVHHIVHIDESNVDDPAVSLSWSNLMAVCEQCHADLHPEIAAKNKKSKRFLVGPDGRVLAVDSPLSRSKSKIFASGWSEGSCGSLKTAKTPDRSERNSKDNEKGGKTCQNQKK